MSDNLEITSGGATYEAPRVNEINLDSGGNYRTPSWPEQGKMDDSKLQYTGIAPQGIGSFID
mgnify:CR=1 FL=1